MSAEVHAIHPPEADLDTAVDFLKTINPDGWQTLQAIWDGGTEVARFEPEQWDQKRETMERWAKACRNIYVQVNEPRAGAKTMEVGDIAFIRVVCSDTDHKGVQDKALASSAAYVNDSGGGIHTFDILPTKVPVDAAMQAKAELAGQGLQATYGGDSVWNINRIMRVPGTVNWLTAAKKAKGRQIAPTAVLLKSDRRRTLDEIIAEHPAPAKAKSAPIDEAEAMADIDMSDALGSYALLPAELRVRFEKTKVFSGLWALGVRNGDVSGSGHIFQLALALHDEGFSGTEFAQIAACWDKVSVHNIEHRALARAWAAASPSGQAKRAFSDEYAEEVEAKGTPPGKDWVLLPAGEKEEHKLPRRQWLFWRRLIRGYLSSTVAAGGTGKSSLTMVEAVSMASKRNLLGLDEDDDMPKEPLRVLIWNGEDPQQELDLRLAAVMKHHQVTKEELGGRLFVISGRDYPLAEADGMKKLVKAMKAHRIDVVIVDPFVSSHSAAENDNMAIDKVAKMWSRIAEEYSCGVDLVHHIRKPASGNGVVDLTVDDARGASALINASRNARVLSPMDPEMAKAYQVNRKAYFAIQHDATKANMAPSATGASWFRFVTVELDNGDPFVVPGIEGDKVGVVEVWTPVHNVTTDPTKIKAAQNLIRSGMDRASSQSDEWAGRAIAEALGYDHETDKKHIEVIIKQWIKDGWLKKDKTKDDRGNWRPSIEVLNIPEDL